MAKQKSKDYLKGYIAGLATGTRAIKRNAKIANKMPAFLLHIEEAKTLAWHFQRLLGQTKKK